METSAHLQQGANAAMDPRPSLCWFCYPRENLQKRSFSSTIATYDADRLALLDLEGDILESPDSLGIPISFAEEIHYGLTQGLISGFTLTDAVFFA
jgi:hypothetical protein